MQWVAKVAVAEWLRRKVLSLEVPGFNSVGFFSSIFFAQFLPLLAVTVLLDYLDPAIRTYFVFVL